MKKTAILAFALVSVISAQTADPFTQEVQGCLTECCQTLKDRPAQTYTFYQNTGHFIGGSGEWHIDTHGYSGKGEGLLNPSM